MTQTLSALTVSFLLTIENSHAQQVPEIGLNEINVTSLSQPVQVVHAGDASGRLFIVQQQGTIRVLDRVSDEEFTDRGVFFQMTGIPSSGEQGLLSMAFHPDFSENKKFFIFYTNADGNLEVDSYLASSDPNRFDPASRQEVITIPHPTYSNHNGGEMHFGPDGFLYISTGDGGSGGDPSDRAQNLNDRLGKILRLDVDGESLFPESNPIPNSPVYASGLRNPFRWSFDRTTNDVWIGDVGQGAFEEINFIPFNALREANFGWRCYEGNQAHNTAGCAGAGNYTFPIHTYAIGVTNGRSVIGGVVYRGNSFPDLQGVYIGTDYFSDKLHIITRDQNTFTVSTEESGIAGITDFGESENGELYAVNRNTNRLYRVASSGPLPVAFVSFSASETENQKIALNWRAIQNGPFDKYIVERSTDAQNFVLIGTVSGAPTSGGANDYTFVDQMVTPETQYHYRIKALDLDGTHVYSSIVSISLDILSNQERLAGKRFSHPNPITEGRITLTLDEPFEHLQLVTLSGQTIQKFELSNLTGHVALNCGSVTPGLYLAILTGPEKTVVEKVIFR